MIIEICLSFFGLGAVMRRARQETKALIKAGYKVVVITDLKHIKYLHSFRKYHSNLRIIPIKLYYLPYHFRKVSSELIFAFRAYRALKELVKKESIELIICHASTNSYAAASFGKKKNISTVLILHELIKDRIVYGNPYNWWTTKLYKHATCYALKNMNYLIGVSNYMKDLSVLDGAKKENTFVNHNPVDLELFYPKKDVIKDIDILFIGRLSVEKGADILIKASQFFEQRWNVTIIGEGALHQELEKLASLSKSNIKFEGWIEFEILSNFINRTRLLVVPSVTEPQGIVVLEGMACGVPVIGSKTGGIPDMIKHDTNGWLVKKNDPQALARLINDALIDDNKLEKIGEKALETAKKFSKKIFEKRTAELYDFLIKK